MSASPIQNEDLTFLERKGRNVDYSSAQLVRAYCSKGYYDNTLKIGPFIMVYLFYSKKLSGMFRQNLIQSVCHLVQYNTQVKFDFEKK